MKLDWRKITRKLILSESDNQHPLIKKINLINAHLSEFKAVNQTQQFHISEIIELVENLNVSTSDLLNENKTLKEKISILEENKINEFLD